MPVIQDISIDLAEEDIVRALRLDHPRLESSRAGREMARELWREARPLLHPRAFFRPAFIETKGTEDVGIEGHLFHSRILRKNLEPVEKVFPYVLTIGPDLETQAAGDDLLHRYYLETLADMALGAASDAVDQRLRKQYGFATLASMSPGSLADWPITEQVPLFALLGEVESQIGVRLTESLLMLPRKSISGIFFPSEESFVSCRLCPRTVCQGRKAPYDSDLRTEYGDCITDESGV
jgi:hypothetical protein